MTKKYNTWKINLINLNEKSLLKLTKLINAKNFHFQQIILWIYKKNITNFFEMNNINKTIKNNFNKVCQIKTKKLDKEIISSDNTIRWLIKLDKNNSIETIAIPNKKSHYTLCISSQIGCTLNCSFCYTGKQNFKRNLYTEEVINQVLQSKIRLESIFNKKKITNIVVMGMGEPLLNITNIISAITIIAHKNTFNIHKNKITISTAGIIPGIKIIESHKIPLALSLHSTNDIDRSKLMPINKKYPIKKILERCEKYSKNNKLTIEYIMLKNINDTKKNAIELTNLLLNIKCKICLIPFNNFPGSKYQTTSMSNIINFKNILKQKGNIVSIRKKLGDTINAACGQLKGIIKQYEKK